MGVALDRLSVLHNSLLCLILSKLPIRDAIKCSVLSKRWRFLYTELPRLVFSPYHLTPISLLPPTPDPLSIATVEHRISKILRLHSLDLKGFFLSNDVDGPWTPNSIGSPWQFTSQSISEWVRCVARKNVERLLLKNSGNREIPPAALFSCTRLTMLTLYRCIITTIPTDFGGFKHLTHCNFVDIKMTDDSLARFILQCPLLRNFNLLHFSIGLQRPVISALNVTDLIIYTHRAQGLTVNCPQLKKLKTSTEDLRVNGMAFHELSPRIERLAIEHGNNLIALSLRSRPFGACNLSDNRFLEIVGTLRSLKVLVIDLGVAFPGAKRIAVPLLKLLSRLPNLERFRLHGDLILEKPMTPSFTYTFANLQVLKIQINKYNGMELGLLGCLVQTAPALKEVKLEPARGRHNEQYNSFLEKWESLNKRGLITENICEYIFYF